MLIIICHSLYAQNVAVLSLDGTGDYVEIAHSQAFDLSQLTLECWIFTPVTMDGILNDQWRVLISKSNEPGDPSSERDYNFYAGTNEDVKVTFLHLSSSIFGPTNLNLPTPFEPQTWHHVAVSVSQTGLHRYFADGVELGQVQGTSGTANRNYSLRIGKSDNLWNSRIDEVRVWNVARTQAEIQANMNQPLTGNETGLVAYYRFDQLESLGVGGDGLVDDVRDFSGKGNHGDLVGDAKLVPATDLSLPVELSAFSGTMTQEGVQLHWRTQSETHNLGFHIYRSQSKAGEYLRITPIRIKGHGTDATPHDYSFLDETAEVGKPYYYYIEDTDFSGQTHKSHIIQVGAPTSKGKIVTKWACFRK